MRHLARRMQPFVVVLSTLLTGACATVTLPIAPPAQTPAQAWQAPLPHGGQTAGLTAWWETFHDAALDELQQRTQASNPDLDRALAAIRRARADLTIGQAAAQPQLNLQSQASRSGDIRDARYTSTSTSHTFDASWETDLFGRNRYNVAALDAERDARSADWHQARVSLAAEVAGDYLDYRACRQRARSYREQDASYRKTLAVTRSKVAAGLAAGADAHLTEAGAAAATANLVAEEARCDTLIKTLVALSGTDEERLRTLLGQDPDRLPMPEAFEVDALPADLLRQRPDLRATERRLFAAWQRVGAAQAARWPDLNLSGSIGVAHTLAVAPNPWSIASALTLPLYSAGANDARVDGARADYAGVLADYDAQVRQAVREVEVALVRLDAASRREQDVVGSARQYRAYLQAAEIDWKSGRLPLLDLETARRNALNAELLAIDVQAEHIADWITLYKALGGGWTQRLDITGQDGRTP